jgi:hypothetical protein
MKQKKVVFVVSFLVVTFFINVLHSFDDLDIGVRGKIFKQSYVSFVDDFGVINYNPALIAKIRKRELGFYYNSIFNLGLIDHTFLGYVQPALGKGGVGFAWNRLGTTSNVDFMKYSENIFIFSYGQRVWKNIFGGINVKYFFVDYDYKASGVGGDLGLFFPTDFCNFGLLYQNFNQPEIFWQTGTKESLSSVIKFSVSKSFNNHLLSLGIRYDDGTDLSLGWHWEVRNNFIILSGCNIGKKDNVTGSLGASFGIKNVKFSYGIELHKNFGINNFLEIDLKL